MRDSAIEDGRILVREAVTGIAHLIGSQIGPVPADSRLPDGFVVRLDPKTEVHRAGTVLFGGQPRQLLRLSESSRAALIDRRVIVANARTAILARRLLGTGLGLPDPAAAPDGPMDVDIVIPVRDRDEPLRRLLTAIRADPHTATARVIVVDDGSVDENSVLLVADGCAAEVVRHPRARGPAAARNSGLASARTEFVAFLDSDCVPMPGWLGRLIGHFADPLVAIAAPRIVSLERASSASAASAASGAPGTADRRVGWLAGYENAASALDMGPHAGRACPGLPLSYVPSAGMLTRHTAIGSGFAEDLMVAEDVDLAWRLAHGGWTVRYEPRATVAHEHRTQLRDFVSRRAFYGTSGPMLGQRHGNAVAPIVIDSHTALAWAGVLIGRPWSVAGALGLQGVSTLRLARTLSGHGISAPLTTAVGLVLRGWLASGRYLLRRPGREYWPLSLTAAACSPGLRRRLMMITALDAALACYEQIVGSRAASAAAGTRPAPGVLGPRAPSLVGFTAARRLEDLAYGLGVWRGAWQARSWTALAPRLVRAPNRKP